MYISKSIILLLISLISFIARFQFHFMYVIPVEIINGLFSAAMGLLEIDICGIS